ncbi:MAG: TspO/MBR family protein [Betaproteobacteria bacterium]|jgi:tryptophan-rich sensory protein
MAGPSAARPEGAPREHRDVSRVPRFVYGVAATVALLVAGVGGLATDLGPWYRGLVQPPWKPPDLVFGPVWTLLYTLTAWAGARAWWFAGVRTAPGAALEGASCLAHTTAAPEAMEAQRLRHLLLRGFLVNAVLNVAWSALFFQAKRPDWALLEIVLLTASVIWLIATCARADRLASRLLWPYLVWVLFAATVNAGVTRLNPLPAGSWGGVG